MILGRPCIPLTTGVLPMSVVERSGCAGELCSLAIDIEHFRAASRLEVETAGCLGWLPMLPGIGWVDVGGIGDVLSGVIGWGECRWHLWCEVLVYGPDGA